MKLYTVGYQDKNINRLLTLLVDVDCEAVVDVRDKIFSYVDTYIKPIL
jgi:hypothetical protein